MSTINSVSNSAIIRQQVYSKELWPPILPMLLSDNFVIDVSDFKDGATYNVPRLGQATLHQRTAAEDTRLDGISTSNFNLTITEFPETAIGIERKTIEDSWIMPVLQQQIMPIQRQAILEYYETKIWSTQSNQAASSPNTINGTAHRWVASGTNQAMTINDFLRAKTSLDKANIPAAGRVAIITPEASHQLSQQAVPTTQFAFNFDLQGVVEQGTRTDMMGNYKLFGFTVYVSNFLPSIASETITAWGSSTSVTNGGANLFFSVANDYVKPFARAWRRQPEARMYVDEKKDLMEVYLANARFGYGLIRTQGLAVCLSSGASSLI